MKDEEVVEALRSLLEARLSAPRPPQEELLELMMEDARKVLEDRGATSLQRVGPSEWQYSTSSFPKPKNILVGLLEDHLVVGIRETTV